MKKLGEMQVIITKVGLSGNVKSALDKHLSRLQMVEELDIQRQANYIEAVKAYDKDYGNKRVVLSFWRV